MAYLDGYCQNFIDRRNNDIGRGDRDLQGGMVDLMHGEDGGTPVENAVTVKLLRY